MRVLYYCIGGGLGHITRFIAWCRYFSIKPALITNCEQVRSGRISVDANPIMTPDEADMANFNSFTAWVKEAITDCRPTKMVIDSFPGGILGELCDLEQLQDISCTYLARILDLPAYYQRLRGNLPKFTKIWRLEKLDAAQENWLASLGAPIETLTLPYSLTTELDATENIDLSELPANHWLIVHSGDREELEQLWHFARQTAEIEGVTPEFVMVSPGCRPDFLPWQVRHYDIYPADHLIMRAARVFSAAGFNIMQQMKFCAARHHVLPIPRALDDQFLRCRLCLSVQVR